MLTDNVLLRSQTYYVRVTAMDGHGNVLAWMRGNTALPGTTVFHQMDGTYEYMPVGAKAITIGDKKSD